MSAALTINTFPAMHTFNSSRSWAMAIIVTLHVGMFWALTAGMAVRIKTPPIPHTEATVIDEPATPRPPPPDPDYWREPSKQITLDVQPPPTPNYAEDKAIRIERDPLPPPPERDQVRRAPAPIMVDPQADPRVGLSEPEYPPSAIREGREGTVLLSIQVLENGRVGEVRIERSSGVASLDNSALREARRWRFRAGTRDGVPVVMWKQLPVTFQLQK